MLHLLSLSLSLLATATADESPPAVMNTYSEGKRAYDAGDFGGALSKFDDCAAMEPGKARWQYNRGLALKKLGRNTEAVDAFTKSRALDADYKRTEIEEKLSQLGAASSARGSPPSSEVRTDEPDPNNVLLGLCACLVPALAIAAFFFFRRKPNPAAPTATRFTNDVGRVTNVRKGAEVVAAALARCEHALSLGEDSEARAQVDRAATNLAMVRRELPRAVRGETSIADMEEALVRARTAQSTAEERLRALYGARFDSAQGPRAGCFFCARALPTQTATHAVTLKGGGGDVTVAACDACARRARSGQAPNVTVIGARHWSSVEAFDPYLNAHTDFPGAGEAPTWKLLTPAFGGLAAFAAGTALGAAAAAVLDLDAAKEAGLAREAATAVAQSTGTRRNRDWQDNS